jgi:hypothetical protein
MTADFSEQAEVRNPFAEQCVANAAASHTTHRHKVPAPESVSFSTTLSGEGHGKDLALNVGPGGPRPDEEDFMQLAVLLAVEVDGANAALAAAAGRARDQATHCFVGVFPNRRPSRTARRQATAAGPKSGRVKHCRGVSPRKCTRSQRAPSCTNI